MLRTTRPNSGCPLTLSTRPPRSRPTTTSPWAGSGVANMVRVCARTIGPSRGGPWRGARADSGSVYRSGSGPAGASGSADGGRQVTEEQRPGSVAPPSGVVWSLPEAPPVGPPPAAVAAVAAGRCGLGPTDPDPGASRPVRASAARWGPAAWPVASAGGKRRIALVVGCVVALLAGLGVAVRLPGPLSANASHAGFTSSSRSASAGSASADHGAIGYEAFDDGARQILGRMTVALQAHDARRFQSVASPGSASMRCPPPAAVRRPGGAAAGLVHLRARPVAHPAPALVAEAGGAHAARPRARTASRAGTSQPSGRP